MRIEIPILHRACYVRADLEIFHIISFLAPRTYEEAIREVLLARGLPMDTHAEIREPIRQPADPTSSLIQRMEAAFAVGDWPDVIRKADYLIRNMPASASASVYRLRGVAHM